jgi:hypothetical protein
MIMDIYKIAILGWGELACPQFFNLTFQDNRIDSNAIQLDRSQILVVLTLCQVTLGLNSVPTIENPCGCSGTRCPTVQGCRKLRSNGGRERHLLLWTKNPHFWYRMN